MTLPHIVVTRRLPEAVQERLDEHFSVTLNASDALFSEDDLAFALQNADGLLCTITDSLSAHVLATPKCRARILANFGVGVNHIDLGAAAETGLVVTNTPDVLTDATADLAIALILASTRRMYESEQLLRSGAWKVFRPTGTLGLGLQGKTLGIVGMGRIGQATARRAHYAFGMNIIYYNRSEKTGLDVPAEPRDSLETLMGDADVISLHLPGGVENRGLITAELIARMRPHAHIINTARGDVIDEGALIDALETGRIAGAGLDVYENEPDVPDRLIALRNVTLLPHIGSATWETRIAMGMCAADNLIAFFNGEAPPNRIA